MAELTEVVRAVGPPVSLLAMSAAGPIALGLAHRRPEWVESLVLFGTFANAPGTFTDARLRDMVVEITRAHWGIGSKILADLYRPGLSDEAVLDLAKVLGLGRTRRSRASYLESLYEEDVSELLPKMTRPRWSCTTPRQADPFHAAGTRVLAAERDVPAARRHVQLPDAKDLDLIQDATSPCPQDTG